MNKQALELNNIKLELANAFIELDKKKNQLVVSQKENESSQSRLENEIKNLTSNYNHILLLSEFQLMILFFKPQIIKFLFYFQYFCIIL